MYTVAMEMKPPLHRYPSLFYFVRKLRQPSYGGVKCRSYSNRLFFGDQPPVLNVVHKIRVNGIPMQNTAYFICQRPNRLCFAERQFHAQKDVAIDRKVASVGRERGVCCLDVKLQYFHLYGRRRGLQSSQLELGKSKALGQSVDESLPLAIQFQRRGNQPPHQEQGK